MYCTGRCFFFSLSFCHAHRPFAFFSLRCASVGAGVGVRCGCWPVGHGPGQRCARLAARLPRLQHGRPERRRVRRHTAQGRGYACMHAMHACEAECLTLRLYYGGEDAPYASSLRAPNDSLHTLALSHTWACVGRFDLSGLIGGEADFSKTNFKDAQLSKATSLLNLSYTNSYF